MFNTLFRDLIVRSEMTTNTLADLYSTFQAFVQGSKSPSGAKTAWNSSKRLRWACSATDNKKPGGYPGKLFIERSTSGLKCRC